MFQIKILERLKIILLLNKFVMNYYGLCDNVENNVEPDRKQCALHVEYLM